MEHRLAAFLVADMVGYTRLIRADEEGTIEALKALHADLIDPKIAAHHGRIVKLMGDGMLAEFPSVVDAVRTAVGMQQALAEHNSILPQGKRLDFRIGINLGDVVIDGDDIQGDGVNVAARLETISEPGGLCVSDVVYQIISSKPDLVFIDLGEQKLKNIDTPIRVWRWDPEPNETAQTSADADSAMEQQVKFCTTADGVNIAYAVVGEGPPLMKSPNWMNHLEYDWESPIWRHLLRELATHHTLVRFDQRGNGLSDWSVADFTFDSMVSDMAAVADAVGFDRFPLIGISQGCSFAVAYAAHHPERVSRLVLYGGFALGQMLSGSDTAKQQFEMGRQMILQGWGKNNPAFRQYFTSLFIPGATKEQMDSFNELQRTTVSPENAVRLRDVVGNIDVQKLLGQIKVPTLVLHCRDDGIVPFESGRRMAAMIPNARFVALEGQNHLILDDEPAWPRFMAEVSSFLEDDEV